MGLDWVHRLPELEGQGAKLAVGIAIANPQRMQMHAGLIFQRVSSPPHVLHLRFHAWLELKQLPHPEVDFFWIEVPVDVDRIDGVVAACKRISDRSAGPNAQEPIKYGISFKAMMNDNGSITYSANSAGLTCATFVMLVLEHQLGFAILNQDSWPTDRPEDAEWHDWIVEQMREFQREHPNLIDDEHIEKVRREKGCARFRPEEVAAAAHTLEPDAPVDFAVAEQDGRLIVETLKELAATG